MTRSKKENGNSTCRVLFSCTGIGIFNRGIETFFREAFDGLKSIHNVEVRLLKGTGKSSSQESVVRCLPRTGKLAAFIGRCTGRSAYAVEQWSSFPGVVREIRRFRPDVIFYSDSNLGFLLSRWRKQIGVPFKLLFSNGGPCHPPFDRTDFVHQVAPEYYDEALAAGESGGKHFLVPYGIRVPTGSPAQSVEQKRALRRALRLPENETIILSVGWIAAEHKRMDYLVNELAQLPTPRPHLVMLGQMDEKSVSIVKLAEEKLGPDGFTAKCVPYEQVGDYYKAGDIFALCSLKEGFGRVYLEALIHGLPVLAHNHQVMRYVLGDEGIFADLSCSGSLTKQLVQVLKSESDSPELIVRRRESARSRFSWPVLAPKYEQMFLSCAHSSRQCSRRGNEDLIAEISQSA